MEFLYLICALWAIVGAISTIAYLDTVPQHDDPFAKVNIIGKAILLFLYTGPLGFIIYGSAITIGATLIKVGKLFSRAAAIPITNIIVKTFRKKQ